MIHVLCVICVYKYLYINIYIYINIFIDLSLYICLFLLIDAFSQECHKASSRLALQIRPYPRNQAFHSNRLHSKRVVASNVCIVNSSLGKLLPKPITPHSHKIGRRATKRLIKPLSLYIYIYIYVYII